MRISSTALWINCVKIEKFLLVCTEYIDHTSHRFLIDFFNFHKSMILKNTRDIKLPNFLYVFHQVSRYSKLSLENFVPRDKGRWHKILGWEVTFCEKIVTLS